MRCRSSTTTCISESACISESLWISESSWIFGPTSRTIAATWTRRTRDRHRAARTAPRPTAAGLKIGAVPVPVSTMMTGKDLTGVALDSRARLLVVSEEFAGAGAAAASSPFLAEVVVCDGPLPGGPPGVRARSWSEFLAGAGPADLQRAATPYPTTADSPGFWLYTSGTTGLPKAAMHRHGSLRTTAETYAREVLALGPEDVSFSVAKVFFAYGLGNSLTFPLSVGGSAILVRDRPSPAGVAAVL